MKDTLEVNNVYFGDCLDLMSRIPDASVDMILADLPYGTTGCSWDVVIPFAPLWEQYNRIAKKNAAIVLTASQPFTSLLVTSNIRAFKYEWIWIKNTQSGMVTAGKRPMKKHENILMFSNGTPHFNETKVLGSFISQNHAKKGYSYKNKTSALYNVEGGVDFVWSEFVHANSVLLCNGVGNRSKEKYHPSQKPVPLFEYFIRTYTKEGDVVLDNVAGSGTTGVACINTNRNFILIEKEEEYYEICKTRITEAQNIIKPLF